MPPNTNLHTYTLTHLHAQKGVALIIVIFAMMLFAVLGWTLANLQTNDFEANLRNFDSEQALSLAEAGSQWALNQLSQDGCWRTRSGAGGSYCSSVDSDCNDSGDWLSTPHSLGSGQYNICCRNPDSGTETGDAVIEAKGFVPGQNNYRATRQTKLSITLGSFNKVLQAKNIFSWSAMHSGSNINGDVQALYYSGDGDGTYNELNVDYRNGASPLPPDGTGDDRIIASEPYPAIDMAYYESEAGNPAYSPGGPNTWAPPRTAVITDIGEVVPGRSRITVDSTDIFNPPGQWNGQALRNITRGSWAAGNWGEIQNTLGANTADLTSVVDWAVGDRVSVVPKILSTPWAADGNGRYYTVDFSCDYFTAPLSQWNNQAMRNFSRGTWAYSDWGVIQSVPNAKRAIVRVDDSVDLTNPANLWAVNNWAGEVKRYRDNVIRETLWYIMSDALFDLRDRQDWEPGSIDGNVIFRRTSLVAEGDIAIKGPNRIHFTERPFVYPNLATQNGDITSPDTPSGGSDNAKRGKRDFDDMLYSQNGNLFFNYLDARAAYGSNVTFDGQVRLRYDSDLTRLTGFTWGFPDIQWQEQ